MDFKQLRAFLTVADTGNVTRAADLLNLVQPAVSRQIRLLEEDVGTELFERERHVSEPGHHGRQTVRRCPSARCQMARTSSCRRGWFRSSASRCPPGRASRTRTARTRWRCPAASGCVPRPPRHMRTRAPADAGAPPPRSRRGKGYGPALRRGPSMLRSSGDHLSVQGSSCHSFLKPSSSSFSSLA